MATFIWDDSTVCVWSLWLKSRSGNLHQNDNLSNSNCVCSPSNRIYRFCRPSDACDGSLPPPPPPRPRHSPACQPRLMSVCDSLWNSAAAPVCSCALSEQPQQGIPFSLALFSVRVRVPWARTGQTESNWLTQWMANRCRFLPKWSLLASLTLSSLFSGMHPFRRIHLISSSFLSGAWFHCLLSPGMTVNKVAVVAVGALCAALVSVFSDSLIQIELVKVYTCQWAPKSTSG